MKLKERIRKKINDLFFPCIGRIDEALVSHKSAADDLLASIREDGKQVIAKALQSQQGRITRLAHDQFSKR